MDSHTHKMYRITLDQTKAQWTHMSSCESKKSELLAWSGLMHNTLCKPTPSDETLYEIVMFMTQHQLHVFQEWRDVQVEKPWLAIKVEPNQEAAYSAFMAHLAQVTEQASRGIDNTVMERLDQERREAIAKLS